MITATTGESMGWSGSTRQNKLAWRIGNEEKTLPRTSSKRLPRNWRIEENCSRRSRSSETSKNWWSVFATTEESYDCKSVFDANSWFTEQSEFLIKSEGIFTILKQWAALERPTFTLNPLRFRVPEPCLATILDCRTLRGILWVLQETYLNDYSGHIMYYRYSLTGCPFGVSIEVIVLPISSSPTLISRIPVTCFQWETNQIRSTPITGKNFCDFFISYHHCFLRAQSHHGYSWVVHLTLKPVTN